MAEMVMWYCRPVAAESALFQIVSSGRRPDKRHGEVAVLLWLERDGVAHLRVLSASLEAPFPPVSELNLNRNDPRISPVIRLKLLILFHFTKKSGNLGFGKVSRGCQPAPA
jgi:hypothetical protein